MTYLIILIAFGVPLLAFQWLIGWRVLLLEWRPILVTVFMATAYLGCADIVALHNGIWAVAHGKRLGFDRDSLVLEEWLLILITNTVIAQSVTLALDADVRDAARNVWLRLMRR